MKLAQLGTIEAIRAASVEELAAVPGMTRKAEGAKRKGFAFFLTLSSRPSRLCGSPLFGAESFSALSEPGFVQPDGFREQNPPFDCKTRG
ncbi:MAG TPA: hypothetical protein ENJ31_06935 [Anaerolineae bacterium]|nr:hypothetical protein [Anaerolineae bacterium]